MPLLTPLVSSLSSSDQALVSSLLELGQTQLFANCHSIADLEHILSQLRAANEVLMPGGLKDYIERGRRLLNDSMRGVNPFANCTVSVPGGANLEPGTDEYDLLESAGEKEVAGLCFVLVAGGLGERLGYAKIKISLPVETQTGMTYMEYFARSILEFQRIGRELSGNASLELPLAIMTSADTHSGTVELLESNDYFGLSRSQVTLMQQGKVPCFSNSDGSLAIDSASNSLDLKPHGHGDVHGLLLQTGLAQKWAQEGRKWLFFFQDTNSLSMRSLCACIGVSLERGLAMNSLSVPRAPGEASGGICKLKFSDGREITSSVEYNLLGPLLQDQGGDTAGPDGNSPFPGNCNILLFRLGDYVHALEKSQGVVPEFVNPKYADSEKVKFKSPTRLECLMQDFALLLDAEKVGFSAMPRWLTFSVVKNSNVEAAQKLKAKQPMDCALSGECEFYEANAMMLRLAGERAHHTVEGCDKKTEIEFNGLKHSVGPRITLCPSFGVTLRSMASKFTGPVTLVGGTETSIVLAGATSKVGDVRVHGAAVVYDAVWERESVENRGWKLRAVRDDESVSPAVKIRGFVVDKLETCVVGQNKS